MARKKVRKKGMPRVSYEIWKRADGLDDPEPWDFFNGEKQMRSAWLDLYHNDHENFFMVRVERARIPPKGRKR